MECQIIPRSVNSAKVNFNIAYLQIYILLNCICNKIVDDTLLCGCCLQENLIFNIITFYVFIYIQTSSFMTTLFYWLITVLFKLHDNPDWQIKILWDMNTAIIPFLSKLSTLTNLFQRNHGSQSAVCLHCYLDILIIWIQIQHK